MLKNCLCSIHFREIAFWTNHNGSKALLIEGQEYYTEFPNSDDSEAGFCIYTIYNKNTTDFRWVPIECNTESIKIGDCCYFGVMFQGNYMVTKSFCVIVLSRVFVWEFVLFGRRPLS